MTEKIYIKSTELKSFIRKNKKLSNIESVSKISVAELLRTGVKVCAASSEDWCVGDSPLEIVMTTKRSFRFVRVTAANVVVEVLGTLKEKLIKRDVFSKNKNKMMCLLGITELEYDFIGIR